MGLSKTYVRYEPLKKFNIITSSNSNIVSVNGKNNDNSLRYVASGAAEDVIVWDTKLAKKVNVVYGDKYECSCLSYHTSTNRLAIGYSNGVVDLYDVKNNENENLGTFSGHTSAITSLAFDEDGHRLATGSMDTDVAIWDVVAEQGLFRLSSHKGSITQVRFMKTYDVLITSSKDTFIKFWDMKNGHCFFTLIGHVTEVWCFTLMKNDLYLVTGSNDSELRTWRIEPNNNTAANTDMNGDDDLVYNGPVKCTKVGSLMRSGLGKVLSLTTDTSSQILCCSGNEKKLELFHFVSEEEALKRYNKKVKKVKKKMDNGDETISPIELESTSTKEDIRYCVRKVGIMNTRNRIRSSVVSYLENESKIKVIASTRSNTFEIHSVRLVKSNAKAESELQKIITTPGHDSDVRCVVFDDSDSSTIISGSANGLKVWNRVSAECLRTIETGPVQTICFTADGRHVLAGLKNGAIEIVDVAAADIIETIAGAHSDVIKKICLLSSKRGCVSCGADNMINIWDFVYPDGVFSLKHSRRMDLKESVSDICCSADGMLMAAALLDCTVKLFYMDTGKLFLSLYGHTLAVSCIDMSDDSRLIATGSHDRSVKIWGLDFGDCHKTLRRADEIAVTSLKFVPRTHFFFTCGKDGQLRQWDADNFQRIVTINAHIGEAWNLAVSEDSYFVVTTGKDRTIRVFDKTDEPLVLEDERETEREKEDEENLATGADSVVYGRGPMSLATKKTVNAEKSAELLLECLKTISEYESLSEDKRTLPPIMMAYNISSTIEYLRMVLRKIRASDMEEVLILLPFDYSCLLLYKMVNLMEEFHYDSEIYYRVLVFLIRIHHKPMVSSQNLLDTIKLLQLKTTKSVNYMRDTIGYNLHSLVALEKQRESEDKISIFQEKLFIKKKSDIKRKRSQNVISTARLKM